MNRDDAALLYLLRRTRNEIEVAAARAGLGLIADIHEQHAVTEQYRREQASAEAEHRALATLLDHE